MAATYRVIHQKKSLLQALMKGRLWTDWYVAQRRRWWGWKEIGCYPSHAEAEHACELHARGDLTVDGGRVLSEYERRDL